jgi:hypothetical protein
MKSVIAVMVLALAGAVLAVVGATVEPEGVS